MAGPVFVTDKSASAPTMDPVTMAELFKLLESTVVLLTDTVFEKFAPAGPAAETMRTKVSELPEAMLPDAVSVVALPDDAKTKEIGRASCRERV